MIKVYIAGPITKGDSFVNVAEACRMWKQLRDLGYHPICPHWSAIQQFVAPVTWEEWIDYDLEMIEECDAVLRLPGESKGADQETEHADANDIPVFYDIDDLIEIMPPDGDDDPEPALSAYYEASGALDEAWAAYTAAKQTAADAMRAEREARAAIDAAQHNFQDATSDLVFQEKAA